MNGSSDNNAQPPDFRTSLVPILNLVCNRMNINHMVDFYCGKDPIMTKIKVDHPMQIQCYDPEIERFKTAPVVTELVFFAIEAESMSDEDVENLLGEIEAITGVAAMISIRHSERDNAWWIRKMLERMDMQSFQILPEGFYMIVSPSAERIVLQ